MNGNLLTLRGVVTQGTMEKIMSFDSNVVGYGWKILDFRIMTSNTTANTAFEASALIHSDPVAKTFNDWDPNTVVGMANISKDNNATMILDYNHVIVQNLFLSNTWSQPVCYIVVLERLDIKPEENIMFMLKERAQTN